MQSFGEKFAGKLNQFDLWLVCYTASPCSPTRRNLLLKITTLGLCDSMNNFKLHSLRGPGLMCVSVSHYNRFTFQGQAIGPILNSHKKLKH